MATAGSKYGAIDREAAETIAIKGLAFLAAEPARLLRFLSASGIDPGDVRARAGTPELLAGILEFLQEDESLLLVFAVGAQVAPETVAPAAALLRRAAAEG